MDLPRPRRPDVPSDLARRRLELLGAHLGSSGRESPSGPADAAADDDRTGPVAVPGPRITVDGRVAGGRHRAAAGTDGPDVLRHASLALTGERPVRRQHVLVGAAVVVLALVATLWWIAGSRPEEVRPLGADTGRSAGGSSGDQASPDVLGGDPTGGAAATPSQGAAASPSGQVVVDVTGKVRRPGIVTLPGGSRVADAVEAAGGSKPGADLASINLARVLVDGEQVVVGLPAVASTGPPAGSAGTAAPPGAPAGQAGTPVNLNTATLEQLDTLPGIGPVTAQAILDHRAEIGRFTSVDELLEVRGIGDARMADLRDLVTV